MSRKHHKISEGEKMHRDYLKEMNAQAENLADHYAKKTHDRLRDKLSVSAKLEKVYSKKGLIGLATLLAEREKYSLAFDAETLTLTLVNHKRDGSIVLDMNSIFEQVAGLCEHY